MQPTSLSIPKYKGRPLVLFPENFAEGWLHPDNADFTMTASQWAEWRRDYYLGIMASPFGIEAAESLTGRWIMRAPHGMSVHGVPKLHPQDK
jgi:hypothetical protein